MSCASANFSPDYVRLSGEIADQPVLDGLARAFPQASIGHAYASTEAGVGFSVDDGREGFPAHLIGQNHAGVEMKVVEGSLQIRSHRTARCLCRRRRAAARRHRGLRRYRRYGRVARRAIPLRRPARRHHQHRRVEGASRGGGGRDQPACLRPDVARAIAEEPDHRRHCGRRCRPRQLHRCGAPRDDSARISSRHCKDCLAEWKVPAVIRFVERLDVTAAGKLARTDA